MIEDMKDRLRFRVWIPEAKYLGNEARGAMFYQEDQFGVNHPMRLPFEHEDRLMQCTGLKDASGKLIYEGDIVELSDKRIMQIGWLEDDAKFVCVHPEIENDFDSDNYKLEIIGNIHSNPELLTQTKN